MGKRVVKRMTANLTDEQWKAVKDAMARWDDTNESDVLRQLLYQYVTEVGIEWPREDLKWGGNRHPLKNGGSQNIQD